MRCFGYKQKGVLLKVSTQEKDLQGRSNYDKESNVLIVPFANDFVVISQILESLYVPGITSVEATDTDQPPTELSCPRELACHVWGWDEEKMIDSIAYSCSSKYVSKEKRSKVRRENNGGAEGNGGEGWEGLPFRYGYQEKNAFLKR